MLRSAHTLRPEGDDVAAPDGHRLSFSPSPDVSVLPGPIASATYRLERQGGRCDVFYSG